MSSDNIRTNYDYMNVTITQKKQSIGVYFECQINKKRTPSDYFFGDFTHWEYPGLYCSIKETNLALYGNI